MIQELQNGGLARPIESGMAGGGDLLAQLNNSLVEPLFHSATPELLQLLTPSSYCAFRDGLL
jgi:hypothetical protein